MDNQSHNKESVGDEIRKAGKQQVFHAPAGYFEKLPVEISEKIHRAPAAGSVRWIPLHLATAAVCLLLIVAAGILYFTFPEGNEKAASDITYEDLYSSGMITQMEESMLMDVLSDPVKEKTMSPAANDEQLLHDYLIDNNTDINLIISEL